MGVTDIGVICSMGAKSANLSAACIGPAVGPDLASRSAVWLQLALPGSSMRTEFDQKVEQDSKTRLTPELDRIVTAIWSSYEAIGASFSNPADKENFRAAMARLLDLDPEKRNSLVLKTLRKITSDSLDSFIGVVTPNEKGEYGQFADGKPLSASDIRISTLGFVREFDPALGDDAGKLSSPAYVGLVRFTLQMAREFQKKEMTDRQVSAVFAVLASKLGESSEKK